MRMPLKVFLVLAAAALRGGPAPAQSVPGGVFFVNPASPALLLQVPQVREELKITPEQADRLVKSAEKLQTKYADEFDKLNDVEGRAQQRKFEDLMEQVSAEAEAGVLDVLTPQQKKRLRQIQLQVRGTEAFRDPAVEKALNLTDEQKKEIHAIRREALKQASAIFEDATGGREAVMKKLHALHQKAMKKAEGVLTADQKKTWKELVGAPFELKWQPPPPAGEGPKPATPSPAPADR